MGVTVSLPGRSGRVLGKWNGRPDVVTVVKSCTTLVPLAQGGRLVETSTNREVTEDFLRPGLSYTFIPAGVKSLLVDLPDGQQQYSVTDNKQLRQLMGLLGADYLSAGGISIRSYEEVNYGELYTPVKLKQTEQAKEFEVLTEDENGNQVLESVLLEPKVADGVIKDTYGGLQELELDQNGAWTPKGRTIFCFQNMSDIAGTTYRSMASKSSLSSISNIKGFIRSTTNARERAATNFCCQVLAKTHADVQPVPFTGVVRHRGSSHCQIDGGALAGNCALIASSKSRLQLKHIVRHQGQLSLIQKGAEVLEIPELAIYKGKRLYGAKDASTDARLRAAEEDAPAASSSASEDTSAEATSADGSRHSSQQLQAVAGRQIMPPYKPSTRSGLGSRMIRVQPGRLQLSRGRPAVRPPMPLLLARW
ncbi:hypothetical protein WJX73_004318 [Symbiochloris irregularis]|uniref:Uncharacterized protein n=1 Tax=Symbiochloris irregularis TaxID=706552 RepID=A0AAW1NV81_9CHLO